VGLVIRKWLGCGRSVHGSCRGLSRIRVSTIQVDETRRDQVQREPGLVEVHQSEEGGGRKKVYSSLSKPRDLHVSRRAL
jgi:hypothetical protein